MEHSISIRRIAVTLLAGCLAAVPAALAQGVDFKVAWSTLGEVASAGNDAVPIQRGAKVVRVDVQPAIVEVAAGTQVCISALQLRAFGPDGRALAGAPLVITVRQDQKPQLQLTRPEGDICMRPARPGEYPIRFTSKLPAPDDTLRGAQVFLRAS
jgi:hypothetical protein